MAGVSYGKGADLPQERVRWVTGEDLAARSAAGERIRCFDARDRAEWAAGSLPGAESLAQSELMFSRSTLQPLIDELVGGGGEAAADWVFFANTAGLGGASAGRELFVMAFLHELGVPLESMARLTGGLAAWREAGRPCPAQAVACDPIASLDALLAACGLPHLAEPLRATSLDALAAALDGGRPTALRLLKELGVGTLAERQALCSALAKARRADAARVGVG